MPKAIARQRFTRSQNETQIQTTGLSDRGRESGGGLLRMFEAALMAISALPEARQPELHVRLDVVRNIGHNFGCGVGDGMDYLLGKYGADG